MTLLIIFVLKCINCSSYLSDKIPVMRNLIEIDFLNTVLYTEWL